MKNPAAIMVAVGILVHASLAMASSAMDRASEYVKARKALEEKSIAMPASARQTLMGLKRFYRVGDSWTVAVSHTTQPQTIKESGPASRQPGRELPAEYFAFRVIALDAAGKAAQIEVKRVSGPDGAQIHPARIESAVLTVGDDLVVRSRTLKLRGVERPIVAKNVSADNAPLGSLEIPAELPKYRAARLAEREGRFTPNIREALKKAALHKDFTTEAATDILSDDVFSRPVEVIWAHGDLWPAFVQTRFSQAVLVSQNPK